MPNQGLNPCYNVLIGPGPFITGFKLSEENRDKVNPLETWRLESFSLSWV